MLPVRVRRISASVFTSACAVGLAAAIVAITGLAAWIATLLSAVILCGLLLVLPRTPVAPAVAVHLSFPQLCARWRRRAGARRAASGATKAIARLA